MDSLLPLATGFIGALIGSATSVITIYIQNKAQAKRERMKVATQLAIEDHRIAHEAAKGFSGTTAIAPISTYVYFHALVLEALESGTLDESRMVELGRESAKVFDALKKIDKEREQT